MVLLQVMLDWQKTTNWLLYHSTWNAYG